MTNIYILLVFLLINENYNLFPRYVEMQTKKVFIILRIILEYTFKLTVILLYHFQNYNFISVLKTNHNKKDLPNK